MNVYGIPGVTVANGTTTYTLLSVGTSSMTASNFTLGNIYNATNFTFASSLGVTTTAVTLSVTQATAQASEYWVGGSSGATGTWAITDRAGVSNWALTSGGAQSLTPGPSATITFSSGATNTSPMILGANMSVAGIVFSDTGTNSLNADGNTLTIGAVGITINTTGGNPTVTLAPPIILGSIQTWQNASSNPLTVSGNLTNAAHLLTVRAPATPPSAAAFPAAAA